MLTYSAALSVNQPAEQYSSTMRPFYTLSLFQWELYSCVSVSNSNRSECNAQRHANFDYTRLDFIAIKNNNLKRGTVFIRKHVETIVFKYKYTRIYFFNEYSFNFPIYKSSALKKILSLTPSCLRVVGIRSSTDSCL